MLARYSPGPEPSEALDPFLTEWSEGRDRAAARHTDAPRVAGEALVANRAGLDGARLSAEQIDLSEDGDRATARVRMRWNVPGIGPWAYDTRVPLRKVDDEWKVHWRVTVVHPKLRDTERLGTTRELPRRAPIRDRAGRAIVQLRPVKRVGAVVGEVGDPRATATGLARVLGVDAAPILSQLRGGGPQQFVEAIVLREDDYAAVRGQIASVPDVTILDGTAPLAPTREFARAVLGTVGPATAEQLEQLGDFYAPGDQVGQWGLQARFERRLAGTPDRRIVMRNAQGVAFETLFERDGRVGQAVRTTLDRRVQLAAERTGFHPVSRTVFRPRPNVGSALTVAKQYDGRAGSKNNVERLTAQWLMFDGELKKLKLIGKDRTDGKGEWKVPVDELTLKSGTYYAWSKRKKMGRKTFVCKPDRSRAIVIDSQDLATARIEEIQAANARPVAPVASAIPAVAQMPAQGVQPNGHAAMTQTPPVAKPSPSQPTVPSPAPTSDDGWLAAITRGVMAIWHLVF